MDEDNSGDSRLYSPARVWRLLLLHPARLIDILLAEHPSQRSLGLAGAFGAFAGTLPILGLHTVLVYYGAQRVQLNRLLALATNQLGVPPVVPALCIEVGHYLRNGTWLTEISMRTLGHETPQRFREWALWVRCSSGRPSRSSWAARSGFWRLWCGGERRSEAAPSPGSLQLTRKKRAAEAFAGR